MSLSLFQNIEVNSLIFQSQIKLSNLYKKHSYCYILSSICSSYYYKKMLKPKTSRKLSYQQQTHLLHTFILTFQDFSTQYIDQTYGRKKYFLKLQNIADDLSRSFDIEIQDIQDYFRKDQEKCIVSGLLYNTERYIEMISIVTEKLMPTRKRAIDPEREMIQKYDNILKDQRRQNIQNNLRDLMEKNQKLPTEIHKKYSISIIYGNQAKLQIKTLSQLKSNDVGGLITTKAIVTRLSQVKPQISVATYACDVCGCQNYQQINDMSYYPLTVCQSKKCRQNNVSGKLTFLASHSKFKPYQIIKIQQTPDQVKPGEVPISKSLILRGNNVKTASPGDIILVQGVLVPTRKLGWGQFDLSFNCHIEGYKVIRQKKKYVEFQLTQEQKYNVYKQRNKYTEDQLFDKLSQAIAPEIYGLKDVKKALLLMMAGGVTKETVIDSLKIRGEINIALIGDPGIAKSQLLKKISLIAPRAIYTTGKGSSGVGLTAAIVKDQKTKQIYLQAGALILADMGICCIDQFDKMDQYDRTAIHQAMQQQTISIAKAGITTTLNARTSILAAANPLYGRYNRNQTAHKNINLPAALLSRFDLVFILLDKPQQRKDIQLSYHICQVHMNQQSPQHQNMFDSDFLRTYIAMCKQFQPTISKELHEMLIKKYIQKRKLQTDVSKQGETYTTTRSLLALIRLCIARAKLRFSNQVNDDDLMTCLEIMEKSQESVLHNEGNKKPRTDSMSEIFIIIKNMCLYSANHTASLEQIQRKVTIKGYSTEAFEIVLKNYQLMGVVMVKDGQVVLLD